MGIFFNSKEKTLIRNIEDDYDSMIEKIVLSLKNLPENQRKKIADEGRLSLESLEFAKMMSYFLFDQKLDVFNDDINNLTEVNLKQIYEIMIIWYTWTLIQIEPDGTRNEGVMAFCIDSLEKVFGISPQVSIVYYKGLAGNSRLEIFALYRWCMLAIGHIDSQYDSMHENSIDCRKFIEIVNCAIKGCTHYKK
jgi:hypothetical protein